MRSLFLLGFFSALSANATILYQFSFTPVNGPFQAASFTLSEPGYLGDGGFSFTPFTMSDGTHTFSFTQGNAGTDVPSAFCFDFGTANTSVGDCFTGMSSAGAPNATLAITFSGNGGLLPSSPGSFTAGQFSVFVSAFVTTTSAVETSQGTVTLTVTDTNPTPEPASAVLCGSMLVALAVLYRRFRLAKFRVESAKTER